RLVAPPDAGRSARAAGHSRAPGTPSDEDGSFGLMNEIRDAMLRDLLRDGLREEAAPISRRLAEVKGLSNNAVRRLERLEETIEAERNARVDDLALLVELLTEGWRTLTARLDRIEAALQPAGDQNVVRL